MHTHSLDEWQHQHRSHNENRTAERNTRRVMWLTLIMMVAEIVTGCDISCLMNILGRISRREEDVQVLHIAQILAGGQRNRGGKI